MVYEMECQPRGPAAAIEIMVNGEARQAAPGQTISGLLQELDLKPERVAVELDRRIVRRAEWDALRLAEGAKLEIVQFVGGG